MSKRRRHSREFRQGAVEQCQQPGIGANLLKRNTLICSMSAVGHCGDNAACGGFFGMLKRERTHRRR